MLGSNRRWLCSWLSQIHALGSDHSSSLEKCEKRWIICDVQRSKETVVDNWGLHKRCIQFLGEHPPDYISKFNRRVPENLQWMLWKRRQHYHVLKLFICEHFTGWDENISGIKIQLPPADQKPIEYIFSMRLMTCFFFSRTPLRTYWEYVMNEKVEYVIRGVEYVINRKVGVRNGVRNNCRNPKPMVDGQKLSKLSYGI